MTLAKLLSPALMSGIDENCIAELCKILKYPFQQRDPRGSRFWYLHPGVDESEARETCPIAVGFYSELNDATDGEIKSFLTAGEPQPEIYKHYASRTSENQPVMYLLLPTNEGAGRVPLVLPNEGGLRRRQIQTFDWNEPELLARLRRLQQGSLSIAARAICSVPLVEWVFYEPIKTAGELARKLAEVALKIEKAIPNVYAAEKKDGYLHKLLESFQRELLPTLQLTSTNEKDYSFADIYAQTIAYGLFTARVFGYVKDQREGREKETDFNRQDVWKQLPETNPFLRRLFREMSEQEPEDLGKDLIEAVADIFGILRNTKMDAILSDFRQKMSQEDIVIRFYEDFLKAYKPQMRELRGVYYTPEPIVSYIVQSVNEILKTNFALEDGLVDASKVQVKTKDGKSTKETHKVLITDIATGTGTFLHSIIDHIHKSFKPTQQLTWSDYVSQHLLPRLSGFELLMAPYAVAHMKLGLQLAELGYKFDSNERLRVYLTNTLQEAFQIPLADGFDNWIRDEADAANIIKQEAPVMVLLGNPPYSGHSANNGTWISNLLKGIDTITSQKTSSYFELDGKPLGEKNPKWLNDDYVKFIRFSQWRIEQTGYGILAFVTNHGYLDNPTFRGMRQSLLETFDDIYVLDLHGNSKKKERCPDGSKDENVFDIQQGVSINIFVKHPNGKKENATVHHANLWGLQEHKYNWLKENNVTKTDWTTLKPQSPFYLFVPQNNNSLAEYEQGCKVTEAIPVNVLGFQTHRDNFAIDFDRASLHKRMTALYDNEISDEQLRIHFDLGTWDIKKARIKLRNSEDWEAEFSKCLHRPFDQRECYFSDAVMDRPRRELIDHVAKRDNLCLLLIRQMQDHVIYSHVFISDVPTIDRSFSCSRGAATIFPLYLYTKTNNNQQLALEQRCPNLSQKFLNSISSKLGYTPAPEAIFHYIYAIFHSPTYRTRYAEFFKMDFPRVPLTSSDPLFRQLATYGEELVALHLMKSPTLDNLITQFVNDRGHRLVDAGYPKFSQGEVVINKKGDKFIGVPENVWNFHVGGYQVCQKWLKDRKGRTLSNEDVLHYQKIVIALKATIELMAKIDVTIPGFPIE